MTIRFFISNPANESKVLILDNGQDYEIENRGKHWVLKEMRHAARVLKSCGISNHKSADGTLSRVYTFESITW